MLINANGKTRIDIIDIAKGIGMILVVLGHIIPSGGGSIPYYF